MDGAASVTAHCSARTSATTVPAQIRVPSVSDSAPLAAAHGSCRPLRSFSGWPEGPRSPPLTETRPEYEHHGCAVAYPWHPDLTLHLITAPVASSPSAARSLPAYRRRMIL